MAATYYDSNPSNSPAPLAGKGREDEHNGGGYVESLSIWPAVANLLQAEQYEQAAELLLKTQLAQQPPGSEASVAFLIIAREICQAYRQYQIEVARHQQALEAASRCARELSQQLYTMFTRPDEQRLPDLAALGREIPTGGAAHPADKPPKAAGPASLAIYCLGPFQVYSNGRLITEWSSLKARSVFKYLATHRETPIISDTLMDIFWPEADANSARHNLHQAIHSLRKILKQEGAPLQPILFEHEGYSLNPELNLWLDYVEFEKQVQAGQRLVRAGCLAEAMAAYRSAAELYRGDFLAEDRYEDWPGLQREHLRQLYGEVMDQLGEYYLQQGEFTETMAICQKLLLQDNCHEQAHRRLMQCYLLSGQLHSAIRQYQHCRQTLKAELDVPPSLATQRLYEQIVGLQQPRIN